MISFANYQVELHTYSEQVEQVENVVLKITAHSTINKTQYTYDIPHNSFVFEDHKIISNILVLEQIIRDSLNNDNIIVSFYQKDKTLDIHVGINLKYISDSIRVSLYPIIKSTEHHIDSLYQEINDLKKLISDMKHEADERDKHIIHILNQMKLLKMEHERSREHKTMPLCPPDLRNILSLDTHPSC